MLASKKQKKRRPAGRDPSALELVKRDALDHLDNCIEIFENRWGFEKLRQIDEGLYEALADQRDMLQEVCGPLGQLTECLEHRDAMKRGWAKANARMEGHLIDAAVVAFPGAKVTSVRHKEEDPFEPPLPLGLPDDEAPDVA